MPRGPIEPVEADHVSDRDWRLIPGRGGEVRAVIQSADNFGQATILVAVVVGESATDPSQLRGEHDGRHTNEIPPTGLLPYLDTVRCFACSAACPASTGG